MNAKVSLQLSVHQTPAIYGLLRAAIKSSLPFGKRVGSVAPITRERAPISTNLLQSYRNWAGCREADASLPAHFFSYWAFPVLTELVSHCPDSILGLLNQGVRLQILRPIPADATFQVRASMASIDSDERRVRMHARVIASLEGQGDCLVIENHTVVPRVKSQSRRPKKDPQENAEDTRFRKIAEWSAGEREGLNFALLTGDFNPIHTSPWFARFSGFKGSVLQGFGQLARTLEAMNSTGYESDDIDVRFIKPMVLPVDALDVLISEPADNHGRYKLRVADRQGNVYLAGSFRRKAAATVAAP